MQTEGGGHPQTQRTEEQLLDRRVFDPNGLSQITLRRVPLMKRTMLLPVLGLLLLGAFAVAGCAPQAAVPTGPVTVQLWHQEGEAENAAQYVQSLADAYTAAHPNVTFEVTNKETEVLREDFQTAALAGAPPSVLWTVNDHAGPFTTAELTISAADLFD